MYKSMQYYNRIEWQMDTDLSHLEKLLTEAGSLLNSHNINDISVYRIIIRELFFNAVIHGNKNNKEKLIGFSLEFTEKNRIKIVTTDAGDGFAYDTLTTSAGNGKEQNSGYPLLYTLAESITFNETGNTVTLIYRPQLAIEDEISVECIDNNIHLALQAELTIPVADYFRRLLIEYFDKGFRCYTFDFKWVKQIDSMCISVLLSFGKMLEETHAAYKLEIINLSADHRSLFLMMGFKQFYTMAEELKK